MQLIENGALDVQPPALVGPVEGLGVEDPANDKLSLLGQLYRRLVEIYEAGSLVSKANFNLK